MAGTSSTNTGDSPPPVKAKRTRQRISDLSPADFQRLREANGYSMREWAALLGCGEQSVRNIESGHATVGRQMGLLAIILAYPAVRALLPAIRTHAKKLCENEK